LGNYLTPLVAAFFYFCAEKRTFNTGRHRFSDGLPFTLATAEKFRLVASTHGIMQPFRIIFSPWIVRSNLVLKINITALRYGWFYQHLLGQIIWSLASMWINMTIKPISFGLILRY
jgi:hypothetical protein